MRKVLMISHGYPPVGGSGMLRTLKFSRYLPDSGWQPLVLTLRRTLHPRLDPRLLAEVPPGTAVYRSPVLQPLKPLLKLRNLILRPLAAIRGSRNSGSDTAAAEPSGPAADSDASSPGGAGGLIKDLLTTPDSYSGWYLPGLLTGLWAVLRHRPSLIYSTSPPPTAHLIGRSLSRLTGLPWAADFRDPWTLQMAPEFLRTRAGRWNRRLEARVLGRAHRIICNTAPLREGMREAYPRLPAEKFVVITNGFDPADFPDKPPPPPAEGPFLFLHTGEFFPDRDGRVPDPFLVALRELIDSDQLGADEVRVRLVGSGEYVDMEPFRRLMTSPTLQRVVEVLGFVPHDEIPAQLAASHALLLFQNGPHFRMQVPAKSFEYLRAGRPLLAVAAPGATADLVNSVAGARALSPEDDAGIRAAILELVRGGGGLLKRDPAELERFSRPELTRRLATVFDELTGSRNAVPIGGEGVKDP